MDERALNILLVEDDEVDVMTVKRAFLKAKISNPVFVAQNGVDALELLRSDGIPQERRLILLDLNMPRMDGREALREIKADPELRTIPIVVLTTSKAEEDVLRTYNLHANCYVTKPVDLEKFMVVVKTIDSFWLTVVTLPPAGNA